MNDRDVSVTSSSKPSPKEYLDRKETMKKIWDEIWDVVILGTVSVACVAAGLLIALTICKVIPTQYSVIGLIITFGVIIGGFTYWAVHQK